MTNHARYCDCEKCAPLQSDVERLSFEAEGHMLATAAGEPARNSHRHFVPSSEPDPVRVRALADRKALEAAGLCPHSGAESPHPVTRYLPGGGREQGTCTLPKPLADQDRRLARGSGPFPRHSL